MHQDVLYDFTADLTGIGNRSVRESSWFDCSTWYTEVTRQMWTLRCFTPASIDARWVEFYLHLTKNYFTLTSRSSYKPVTRHRPINFTPVPPPHARIPQTRILPFYRTIHGLRRCADYVTSHDDMRLYSKSKTSIIYVDVEVHKFRGLVNIKQPSFRLTL